MSKKAKDDTGGVWVNIYKALKNRDVYWTGSVGYSTKENSMTDIADKLHYIATIDIKQALEHDTKIAKVKQQLAIAVEALNWYDGLEKMLVGWEIATGQERGTAEKALCKIEELNK